MQKNKKGFTLVELIVVLVILAILAALLIPALTGYIDKSKSKTIIAATRQVVSAAQTETAEFYGGTKNSDAKIYTELTIKTPYSYATNAVKIQDVVKLAEVGYVENRKFHGANGVTYVEVTISEAGKVTHAVVEQNGKKCTYTADAADGSEAYKVE